MDAFRRHTIIGGSMIAASLVVAAALVAWVSGDMASRAERIAKNRVAIRDAGALTQGMLQIRTMESQIVAYETRMAALLPKEERLLQFGGWIGELETKHRVIAEYRFQGESAAPSAESPGIMEISLTVLGALEDVRSFFADIESDGQRYLVGFTGFEATEERAGQYAVAARGRIFFRE
jgi:hypothetical protein